MKYICPLIVVEDIAKSRFLYETLLGQKVFRFYDNDKNIIEIGERLEHVAYRLSLEGKTVDAIRAITFLPVEAVKTAIKEYGEDSK